MLSSRTSNTLSEFVIQDDEAAQQQPADVVADAGELKVESIDNSKKSEEHLLQLAVIYDKVEIVKQLLKRKRQVTLQDKDGRTLLHYAAWFGEENIVAECVSNPDINVNLTDEAGQSALHHAAFHGNEKAVAVLLSHKETDVNLCDNEGKSPLRLGVFFADVVAQLLKHNTIDVNIQDEAGKSPLHYAVEANLGKSVAQLLTHESIKINLADKKGWTPFSIGRRLQEWPCRQRIIARQKSAGQFQTNK